jgi:excisionase family DNA binding protein
MDNIALLPRPLGSSSSSQIERKYYRPSEVAAMTGDSLSSVLRSIYAGQLEAHRKGRGWFIPAQAIDTWIMGSDRSA